MKGSFLPVIGLSLLMVSCAALPYSGKGDDEWPLAAKATSIETTTVEPANDRDLEAETTWWKPVPRTTWQWQLDGEIDLSHEVEMYDLDLFETNSKTVQSLKDQGRTVICYISVGSWEDWRPDAGLFPKEVIGNAYGRWPGEKWLDIRRIDLLGPIMEARLDLCAAKGFDGVEPDNIDAYTNNTGFPLTYEDQLTYNLWLVEEAHQRGLSIGLKNDPEQVSDLQPYFDWALTEECFVGQWCDEMRPFIDAGKAVFAAEYVESGVAQTDLCEKLLNDDFSPILKNLELDAFVLFCD